MRLASSCGRFFKTAAWGIIPLFGMIGPLHAQEMKTKYPTMAPIEQYLMDRDAEIALARSAAPEAISRDATVLVLGQHGYETAIQGKNGFVCMVERGWVGWDWPEFWSPRIRGADCLNAPAARSILPIAEIRTEMVLEGRTKPDVQRVSAAISKREVPPLEPGAMGYMLSKGSYLTDEGGHNAPHLMFFIPLADAASWGAGLPGSPVFGSGPYWSGSEKTSQVSNGLPPIRVFNVGVNKWSDGTASLAHLE